MEPRNEPPYRPYERDTGRWTRLLILMEDTSPLSSPDLSVLAAQWRREGRELHLIAVPGQPPAESLDAETKSQGKHIAVPGLLSEKSLGAETASRGKLIPVPERSPGGTGGGWSAWLRDLCRKADWPPSSLLLLSDRDDILEAARRCGIASAGFHRQGQPYLDQAAYQFEAFDRETGRFLDTAYCRFHGLPLVIALTPRLLLRETCMEDLGPLLRLYREAGCPFPLPEPYEESLPAYIRAMYDLRGLGMYTALHRATGALIGHFGFDLVQEPGERVPLPSLGYILAPRWQKQGYALEAARTCLDHLRRDAGCPCACCRISPANTASLALAKKLGFQEIREKSTPSSCFFSLNFL